MSWSARVLPEAEGDRAGRLHRRNRRTGRRDARGRLRHPDRGLYLGVLVCPFCYGAILLKGKLGYDDSLDVFGVHGIGGAGRRPGFRRPGDAALTGQAGGLLDGNADLLFAQAIAVAAVAVYTVVVTSCSSWCSTGSWACASVPKRKSSAST